MDIRKDKVNGSETHLNVHYLRLKKSKKNHFYKQINRHTTQLHRCEISNKHPSIPHSKKNMTFLVKVTVLMFNWHLTAYQTSRPNEINEMKILSVHMCVREIASSLFNFSNIQYVKKMLYYQLIALLLLQFLHLHKGHNITIM